MGNEQQRSSGASSAWAGSWLGLGAVVGLVFIVGSAVGALVGVALPGLPGTGAGAESGGGDGPQVITMGEPLALAETYAARFNDAQSIAAPMPDGEWNGQGWLFVANEVGRGIAVYDMATQRAVEFVYFPDSPVPHHPYISPDQRWVSAGARFGNETAVIDTHNDFATTFLAWPESADGGVAGPLHGTYTSTGDRFLTALQRSDRVGVVDFTSGTPEIAEVIDVGKRPRDIYITPDDSRAFVSMQNENRVAVIDLATYEVRYIPFTDADYSKGTGTGSGMSVDGALFAVANTVENEVVIIDVATEQVSARVPGIPDPVNVEFMGNTHRIGTGNRSDGSVSFIDGDTGELLATVPTGGGANIPSIGPTGEIWVTHNGAHHVSVLDPDTFEEIAKVETGVNPHWIYYTPWGSRAFVTNWGENTVSVIDTVAHTELGRIATGLNPNGMAIKSDVTEEMAEAALERAVEKGVTEKISLAGEMVLPEPRDPTEDVFLNTCTQCHDLGRIVRNNAKGDDWIAIVNRMQGNGAQMTEESKQQIIDYLMSGKQQDLEFGTRYDEKYGSNPQGTKADGA